MPIYNFVCNAGHAVRRLLDAPKAGAGVCDECGAELRRAPTGPNSTKMETLDNGAMTKRLERPADAERMASERAREHSRSNRENK